MKYVIIWIYLLISINTFAESIHFRIVSKTKLKSMEEKGITENLTGVNLVVDLDLNLFYDNINPEKFSIIESSFSEEEEGNYYSLTYNIRTQVKNYVTILFPSNDEDLIIIIVTDKKGNGWFYYAEMI